MRLGFHFMGGRQPLHRLISLIEPTRAAKITGMLLEQPIDAASALTSTLALLSKVDEALAVIANPGCMDVEDA